MSSNDRVGDLSATERVLVAIARAFWTLAHEEEAVVILDEPTAALPEASVDRVFEILQSIRSAGGTVIYVTHRIDEVLRIANQVVVLRDGKVVADRPLGELDSHGLAELIVGQTVGAAPGYGSAGGRRKSEARPEEELLEARGLQARDSRA